jgi:hypothetical protein
MHQRFRPPTRPTLWWESSGRQNLCSLDGPQSYLALPDGQHLNAVISQITRATWNECEYHAVVCGVPVHLRISLEPLLEGATPEAIVVRHGHNEAVRSWPIHTVETTFAGELVAWLREVHAYENYQPAPPPPPRLRPVRRTRSNMSVLVRSQVRDLLEKLDF